MTLRERLFLTGMIVLGLLLVGLGLWQQVRYSDAENAIRQYAQLEDQVDRSERERADAKKAGQDLAELDEDPDDVLARQARPEIRRSLTRGEFSAVLQRISALREESGVDPKERRGPGISVDAIWPPSSKEREQVKTVLRLLATKQDQGYDMAPAQEMLLSVAEAARSGKKKQAQELFLEVEARVKNAVLRPGFQSPAAEQNADGNPAAAPRPRVPGAGPGAMPAYTEQQLQQMTQFLNVVLPQVMSRPEVTPQQRRIFARFQVVGNQAVAAYRQGKDVRPAIVLLQSNFGKVKDEPEKAMRLLDRVEMMIRDAKPMPGGRPAGPAPAPPQVAGSGPRMPGAVAPALPRVGGMPPGGGPRMSPEQVLTVLDQLRKMPDAQYQRARPMIAGMLQGLPAGGAPGAKPPSTSGVGKAEQVRLEFGAMGQIVGAAAHGKELAGGTPGGLALLLGDGKELALASPVKPDGKSLVQRVPGPEGLVQTTYATDGDVVKITVRARRDQPGKAGEILLRLPVQAAGWRWQTGGGEPQVMAVDGTYAARPEGASPLDPVVLRGAGLALKVNAPTAGAVSWEPAGSFLVIRLPIGADKGVTEHVVTLTGE